MSFGVQVRVWGEYACFTRPEMKVERVSYDVITPSAARGILEAIHWKPAIRWVIERIYVLNPIRFQNIRKNEVGKKISVDKAESAMKRDTLDGLGLDIEDSHLREQRAMLALRDVDYVICAHFKLTDKADPDTENVGKHLDVFNRRLAKGQCFQRPCLGLRECIADFEPCTEMPKIAQENYGIRDLGWMLYDIDFAHQSQPRFYRAEMQDGCIDLEAMRQKGSLSV